MLFPVKFFVLFLFFPIYTWSFDVTIDTTNPVRSVPNTFLSLSYDACNAQNPNWWGLNFSLIQPLASAIRPLYFRFGGTSADFVTFLANGNNTERAKIEKAPSFVINGSQLDTLVSFSQAAGWKLIFDLNQMYNNRQSNQTWDSSNAKALLDYASSKGYAIDFELGNEQDCVTPRISGTQAAQDYKDLKTLLNTYDLYKNSLVMGPSTCYSDPGYSEDFLKAGGGNYINAFSFHQYYFAGGSSNLDDFVSVSHMNSLKGNIDNIIKLGFKPVWLGETSTAYNGGGVNKSDTFVAGYLWLDKLGISALHGLDGVIRQQIYGCYQIDQISSYSLLSTTREPGAIMRTNPDYWLTLLYKKVVGLQVFNATFTPANDNLRLYANSHAKNNGYVVYGFNLGNTSISLDIPQLTAKQVTAYVFTPAEPGNLESWFSLLNGQNLTWQPHQPVANINGQITNLPLNLPAYAQFYIVFSQSTTKCPDGWAAESTIPNKCIKLVSDPQPWFAANFDCTTYGKNASLLSINSAFENAEVLKNTQGSKCKNFNIGLYRNGNNFVWSDGNSGSYRNWRAGSPSADTTQNCVYFDPTAGDWYSTDCDPSACYICEQFY